jgi:hypothetical protein
MGAEKHFTIETWAAFGLERFTAKPSLEEILDSLRIQMLINQDLLCLLNL